MKKGLEGRARNYHFCCSAQDRWSLKQDQQIGDSVFWVVNYQILVPKNTYIYKHQNDLKKHEYLTEGQFMYLCSSLS